MGAEMAHKDFRRILRKLQDEGATVGRVIAGGKAIDVMSPGGQLLIRLPGKKGSVEHGLVQRVEEELKRMGYLQERKERMRVTFTRESDDMRRGRVTEKSPEAEPAGDEPVRTDRSPRHVGVIQVGKGRTRGPQPQAGPPRGRYYYQREWAGRVRHEVERVLKTGVTKRDFVEWAIMVADEKGIPFPTYRGSDPNGERDADRILRALEYLLRRNGGGTSRTLRFFEIAAEEHFGERRSLKVEDIAGEPEPTPEPKPKKEVPVPEPVGLAVTDEEFEAKFGRTRSEAELIRERRNDPDAAVRRRYVELLISKLEAGDGDADELMERI